MSNGFVNLSFNVGTGAYPMSMLIFGIMLLFQQTRDARTDA